ncbi:WD40 repeat domain-containing serine/threonine protein kinase [Micromonospora musae]|uniref:WD40 repeat domain-containing serine/threonine protein kinase n=1 Tax=Micromonospora musae TaxID=1894970 RepID=UPI00340C7CFE
MCRPRRRIGAGATGRVPVLSTVTLRVDGEEWGVQESGASQRLVAGRYRLATLLGRGGMGVVWRATDELIGRDVAVKEVRPAPGLPAAERAVFAQRALREARTAGRIHHPAVVSVHDVVPPTADDDAVYIVSELVDAPSLADVISADGAIPAARVAVIAVRILDALASAHATGVVHRDVKPSNIMLLSGDHVKLVDFGIAQSVEDPRLTRSGVMGSTGYLAPELFHRGEPGPAADLWAVGVTLLQAVTGQAPFERDSTAATIHAVLYDELPTVSCDPPLAPAITGLLTREPDQRMTLEQARAVLAGAALTAQEPPPAAVRTAPNPEAEDWEQHSTRMHDAATPRPAHRPSRTPAPSGPAPGFPVSPPPWIGRTNLIAVVVLLLLGGWLSWLLLYKAMGVPLFMFIPASLLVLTIGIALIHYSWPGRLDFRDEALVFIGGQIKTGKAHGDVTLRWDHVDEVFAAAGSADRTVLEVGLSRTVPAIAVSVSPFKGFLRARPGYGPVWTVGELLAPPEDVTAAILAVAPDHVRVASATDEPSRTVQHRPRRGGLTLYVLLVLSLIGSIYFYRHEVKDVSTLSEDETSAVAYAPGGTALASATGSDIAIWNLVTRQADALLAGQSDVTSLEFSPDGKLLVSGDKSGNIRLWDVEAQRPVDDLTIDEGVAFDIESVRFSPDGKAIAALDNIGRVGLWRLTTPVKLLPIDDGSQNFASIRFSTDGRLLLGLESGTGARRYWQTSSGAAARPGGTFAPIAIVRSDYSVLIRDARSDQILTTLRGNTHAVTVTAFGPGDLFATASWNDIRVWRIGDGQMTQVLGTDPFPITNPDCTGVAFSPAGDSLACASDDGLRLWTFGTGSGT